MCVRQLVPDVLVRRWCAPWSGAASSCPIAAPPREPECMGSVGPVKVEGAELLTVELPLVTPFRTSYGDLRRRAQAARPPRTDAGTGWGECGATAEPLYTSEYVDAAATSSSTTCCRGVAEAGDVTPDDVATALAPVQGHRMAKAALEMAVLDAWGRLRPIVGVAARLDPHRRARRGAVGVTGSVDELLAVVEGYVDEGYRRVKLKIQPGWDIEPVAAVRERFGTSCPSRSTPTRPTRLTTPRHLAPLDAFDLLLIEQPLAEDDLAGHAALASDAHADLPRRVGHVGARPPTPSRSAPVGDQHQAGSGRRLPRGRAHPRLVPAHGVPVWCGGMLETGLGRAANVALAALPGFTLPGDLSASRRYSPRPDRAVRAARRPPPRAGRAGLGVEVDEDRGVDDRRPSDLDPLAGASRLAAAPPARSRRPGSGRRQTTSPQA